MVKGAPDPIGARRGKCGRGDRSRVIQSCGDQESHSGPRERGRRHRPSIAAPCDRRALLPTSPVHQTPHAHDEIYVVVGGRGVLLMTGRSTWSRPGTSCSLAAGVEHQFDELSGDFAVWGCSMDPMAASFPEDRIGMASGKAVAQRIRKPPGADGTRRVRDDVARSRGESKLIRLKAAVAWGRCRRAPIAPRA